MSATKSASTRAYWNFKHDECSLRLLSEVLMGIQASAPLSVMPMSFWLAPGWLRWMRQYGPCQELSLTCWADGTQHKCDPVGLIPHSAAPTNISCMVLSVKSQACWEEIKAFHFRMSNSFLPLLFSFLPVGLLNWNDLWWPLLLWVFPGHAGSGTTHYTQLNLSIDRHNKTCTVFCSFINGILGFKARGHHWLPCQGWQHGPKRNEYAQRKGSDLTNYSKPHGLHHALFWVSLVNKSLHLCLGVEVVAQSKRRNTEVNFNNPGQCFLSEYRAKFLLCYLSVRWLSIFGHVKDEWQEEEKAS